MHSTHSEFNFAEWCTRFLREVFCKASVFVFKKRELSWALSQLPTFFIFKLLLPKGKSRGTAPKYFLYQAQETEKIPRELEQRKTEASRKSKEAPYS